MTFVLNVCTIIILILESSDEGAVGYYDESKSGSYLVPLILLLLMNIVSNFGTSSVFKRGMIATNRRIIFEQAVKLILLIAVVVITLLSDGRELVWEAWLITNVCTSFYHIIWVGIRMFMH